MNYITIKEQKVFSLLYKRGRAFHSDILTLLVIPNELTYSAFVVSRKVGNAVCRNLVKRRLRALFDSHANHLPRASYLWIAKPAISSVGFDTIGLEMERLGSLAIKVLNKRHL